MNVLARVDDCISSKPQCNLTIVWRLTFRNAVVQVAEAEAGSSSGANALWGDKRTVPAALQLLAVPAAGPKHMNFEHDDFQRALKVAFRE